MQQAARLTRFVDRKQPNPELETEWLITSRPGSAMSVEDMAKADRRYWGIENGLHLRLDVSAGEDRSRVSTRRSALNLAMIRRATLSIAIDWIQRCPNPVLSENSQVGRQGRGCWLRRRLWRDCKLLSMMGR